MALGKSTRTIRVLPVCMGDLNRVLATTKNELFSAQVEATPLATFNPFALAQAATYVPVVLVHGTADGRRSTLNIPSLQIRRMQGLQNNQNIKEWPLTGAPIATLAGNDQWTLKFT